jgi:phenylpropionate dioxygenase-like ring-hydroxylating dioxygenase large terminal subunit
MRPRVQLEVMRRLIAMIEEPSSEIPTRSSHVAVNRYVDPVELEKEKIALFHRQPIIVAHVSEVPKAGNFVTEEVGGVPLVVLRDSDNEIRVFMNACRHRGARLIGDENGTCKKAITCPYHAWSYGLDGSLLHIPNEEVFDALDRANFGLRAVQHEVRHGFVWALIDPPGGAGLDVATALGTVLDDDFDAFGLATHHVARKVSTTRAANWKLVMDAFAEGYHLKSLHRTSLARFFLNGQIVDDCAPHVRQVGARKTLLEAAKGREDEWDFRRDTTPFYNVFPNAVLVFHPLWLSQMSLMPEGVDRVRIVHRMLVAEEPADEMARARLEKSFTHIHEEVFEKEDLAIVESIQTTLRSGANDSVLMGGLEEGMRLFHLARDRALAEVRDVVRR